jgi:menaquinone-specific isochorismate synthase
MTPLELQLITSLSVEKKKIDKIDPIAFLQNQTLFPKIYLSDRVSKQDSIAFGSFLSLHHIPDDLVSKDCKFYGVTPFSLEHSDVKPFFFLPQYEIIQTDDDTYLYTYHLPHASTQETDGIQWESGSVPSHTLPIKKRISHSPDHASWRCCVEKALHLIFQNNLTKVVLARETQVEFHDHLSAFVLLNLLKKKQLNTTIFYFARHKEEAFIGSTPEKLFSRKGCRIETEALAGTVLKSVNIDDRIKQKEILKKAAKETQEVSIVESYIKKQLNCIGHDIDSDCEFSVIETPQLLHLYKKISCILKDKESDRSIIHYLHPTPAVGGEPLLPALSFIHQHESFDRRWYAGAIGYLSSDEADFSVAIRSAYILQNTLFLYAGTGIVQGSSPDLEWQELDHKISQYMEL